MVSVEFYQVLLSDNIIEITQMKKLLREVTTDYNNGMQTNTNKHLGFLQEKKMTSDAATYLKSYVSAFYDKPTKTTAKKTERSYGLQSELSNNRIKNHGKRLKHQWELDDQNYEITRDYNEYVDANYYDNN